jgi:t-SNARE complex subunit (syntaxin)
MDLKKLIENSNEPIQLENLKDLEDLENLEKLEDDIKDIDKIYKNINEIINLQGKTIDTIEENMDQTRTQVEHTTNKISDALSHYESYKYYQYVLYGLAVIGTALLII